MTAAIATIRGYLQSYYDAVFHKGYFAGILIMLSAIIFFNYNYSFPPAANQWLRLLAGYLLYLLPFAFAYLLQWFYFDEDRSIFSKKAFWFLLFFAPALFAIRVSFNLHESYVRAVVKEEDIRYSLSVINYVVKVFVLIIPVIITWYIKDRKWTPLYGFSGSKNNRLYFLLLALMVPLILLAATRPDFLAAYPKAIRNAGLYSSDDISRFLLFELAYGLDFLSIEFFFRGFLIIAFIRYAGMRAIIPAACFYCCIHLGKPMPEAVSSFFGGLLLGIISYHTRSIWGGLLIHVGIAWLMEITAYIIHHF